MSADGVLVVDKPGQKTSHDVVAQARRLFATREVGHAGTLDPMATGVLLLLFGEATKLSSFLTLNRKRYLATISLGRATDTLDADGRTTAQVAIDDEQLSSNAIAAALGVERARQRQVPPAVSAIKVEGRRAYALTRSGNAPELAERDVRVESLKLISMAEHELTVEVEASKGYYVRSLARDLGLALGLPAHLSKLRRLASGKFELGEACSWPPLVDAPLISTAEAARRVLPFARLTEGGERRARLGQSLADSDFTQRAASDTLALREAAETEAWFNVAGELIALGHERAPGDFRVVRGMRSRTA